MKERRRSPRGGPAGGQAQGSQRTPELCPRDTARVLGLWLQDRVRLHAGLLARRFPVARADGRLDPWGTYGRAVRKGDVAEAVEILDRRSSLLVQLLRQRGWAVEERVVRARSRVMSGLGSAHPTEVGFTWHHLGCPYLPASGLKGLARATAGREGHAALAARLFGEQIRRGAVMVLDAYPVPGARSYLELDVMNPHVPKYYAKDEDWPGEWQDPVPIPFVAVPAGVRFRVVTVGQDAADVREAMGFLIRGLGATGAGAKRGSGYGWLEADDVG